MTGTSPKHPSAGLGGPPAPRAWQRMLSGRRLDLLDPDPADVSLDDLAHGLARVARWNGQTVGTHAFSVAQHSLLVCDLVRALAPSADRQTQLAALLHDAPEYVIGDLISPFKATIGPDYRAVEARLLNAILMAFDLPNPLPATTMALIKQADRISAYFEATRLAGFDEAEADAVFGRPPDLPHDVSDLLADLTAWPTDHAQAEFKALAHHLSPGLTT